MRKLVAQGLVSPDAPWGEADGNVALSSSEVPPPIRLCSAVDSLSHRRPRERSLPGMTESTYHIDVGQDVCHVVENLQKGEVVEWVVEETQAMTIDLTVLL